MSNVQVCQFDDNLVEELKKFRFSRSTADRAIVMKIDTTKMMLVIDEHYEDTTTDELREELPGHQPRFVIYSFKLDHGDGRISYPMCLLFSTPRDCKTELMVMYAGTKLSLVKAAELTKVYEIRDLDELTDDWLQDKMK